LTRRDPEAKADRLGRLRGDDPALGCLPDSSCFRSMEIDAFFPATAGAAGFLQSAFHFCFGFAMRGVYLVALYSILIGIAVAVAGFFLSF
jgi:hypothetical protein